MYYIRLAQNKMKIETLHQHMKVKKIQHHIFIIPWKLQKEKRKEEMFNVGCRIIQLIKKIKFSYKKKNTIN